MSSRSNFDQQTLTRTSISLQPEQRRSDFLRRHIPHLHRLSYLAKHVSSLAQRKLRTLLTLRHSKYKSWRITASLPWGGLVFVAGFAMQTVSIYKDHDLGIFIAKTVLLLIAPSVNLFCFLRPLASFHSPASIRFQVPRRHKADFQSTDQSTRSPITSYSAAFSSTSHICRLFTPVG